jgi:hypothetical protein
VACLLSTLQWFGSTEQVTRLLDRDPANHVCFDIADSMLGLFEDGTAGGVAFLLKSPSDVQASEQVATLLARDPAEKVTLDSPHGVVKLLHQLRELGAEKQFARLLERTPAAGWFSIFDRYGGARFPYGLEPTGEPAPKWSWDDLF